jgi:hypothetical protein
VLDVAVTKVRLQRARVVALICERVAASVPKHVRMGLEPKLCCGARALDARANAAVVKGDPHSEVNTNGELGSCDPKCAACTLS